MKKREKWWKILPTGLFSFGALAGILAFLPDFSATYLVIGIVLAIVATTGAAVQRIEGYERAKFVTVHAGLLMFFLMGARLILLFTENNWLWILVFGVVYVLAWLLPYINPNLSRVINREQVAPETKTGILAMNIAWTLLPIISAGGAFIGMWINRADKMKDASIYLGLLAMFVSIGWAQTASHQLWDQWREVKQARG